MKPAVAPVEAPHGAHITGPNPPTAPLAPSKPIAARSPLPLDASNLPPMGAAYEAVLDAELPQLGVSLAPGPRAAIEAHARLLVAWTRAINLTRIREPAAIASAHVVDSLSALPTLDAWRASHRTESDGEGGPSLLDLGSGGGYPGIPLAMALPLSRGCLVDATLKKARFLEVAIAAAGRALEKHGLQLPSLTVAAERAEALGLQAAHRERWDIVTCRAVGALAEVAEIGLPLVARNGILMCWKRDRGDGALAREIGAARSRIRQLGGSKPEVIQPAGERPDAIRDHRLIVISKLRPTPGGFPRSVTERRRALIR